MNIENRSSALKRPRDSFFMNRKLLLACALLALIGCGSNDEKRPLVPGPEIKSNIPAPNPEDQFPSRVKFQDDNFGISFEHSELISTSYNPHGGADRVLLSFNAKPIGGMKIAPRPMVDEIEQILQDGKEHYKTKYGASSVTYLPFASSKGYKFHHLRAEILINGSSKIIDRFVYLRNLQGIPADVTSLEFLSGSISFEIITEMEQHDKILNEVHVIINTFDLNPDIDP